MENSGKTIEELNNNMTFEEYKQKSLANTKKESKLKKVAKGVALFPFKFLGALFGVNKENIMSSFGSGNASSCGHSHSAARDFRSSQRVDPPPRRTHEDMVREHIAHDAYMDLVDGKGDDER